jgi:hypothetical protein
MPQRLACAHKIRIPYWYGIRYLLSGPDGLMHGQ